MRTCRDVTRAIASGEAEDLGWAGRLEIRLHLLWCRHCRRYRAQLRAIGRAARRVFEDQAGADADLRRVEQSILERVARTAEQRPPDPPP